jgi:hypothetical protein
MPKERLKNILETAEGPFNFLHIVLMAYGAADDKPLIILLAIASLIIGNILGRKPKKKNKPGDDHPIGRRLRHS